MQPISAYAANTHIRLILQGPPGSGKTTLACRFPKPYIIDIDVNLAGTLRHLRQNNLPLPVGFDRVDIDEKGAIVPMAARYQRLDKLLFEAQTNPEIETIVIDSATTLSDIVIAETLRRQSKTQMGIQEWGFFLNYGKALLSTLAQMRKNIVLIAHELIEKNEDGAVVYPVKLNWPGKLAAIMGALFTDVWRAEIKEVPSGAKSTYKWYLRTMPNHRYELKNSLGLDPEFEFDWSKIAAKLGT